MTKTEEKESCKACNHEICKVCKDCHNEYCDLSNKEPTKACYDQLLPKNESMPQQNWKEELIEKFAEIEHERWSKWQKYMHSKCMPTADDGIYQIGEEFVARWNRQINTPYSNLSEEEKQSDRDQVIPYIIHIETLFAQQKKEIVEWSKELIGKHNARILNEFQKQGTAEMPLIAYDERICLIPAITIAMEETDSDIITKLSK